MIQNNKKLVVSLIIAVVLLLLLFLVKDTWRGYVIESLGGYTKQEQTTKIDTLPSKIDTIYYPSVPSVLPIYVGVPKIEYKDTIIYKDKVTNKDIITIRDSTLVYNNVYEDTLIKGSIETRIDLFDCTIVKQDLRYESKRNYTIKETIPIKEVITTVVEKGNRNKLGVGVTASNIGTIGVGGIYQLKNNLQFQLNYSILGGNNKIQIGDNTFNNVISIGVYKTF